jgi:hypothetical protein
MTSAKRGNEEADRRERMFSSFYSTCLGMLAVLVIGACSTASREGPRYAELRIGKASEMQLVIVADRWGGNHHAARVRPWLCEK